MSARFFSPISPAKKGVYGHFTSVKWALDFQGCTSVHLPSLTGTFDILEVAGLFPDVIATARCGYLKYDRSEGADISLKFCGNRVFEVVPGR